MVTSVLLVSVLLPDRDTFISLLSQVVCNISHVDLSAPSRNGLQFEGGDSPDVIVYDLRAGGIMSDSETVRQQFQGVDAPEVLLVDRVDESVSALAQVWEACGVIAPPVDAAQLRLVLETASHIYNKMCQLAKGYHHSQIAKDQRQHMCDVATLSKISESLAEVSMDYQAVLETIANVVAEEVGDGCLLMLLDDESRQLQPVAWRYHSPGENDIIRATAAHWPSDVKSQLSGFVVDKQKPFLYESTLDPEMLSAANAPHNPPHRYGFRGFYALPLTADNQVIGAMAIIRGVASPKFSEREQALLQRVAKIAAVMISHARLFMQVSESHGLLQDASRRLVDVQEAERRNLSRELHDEIGQILTGLLLSLEADKWLPEPDLRNRIVGYQGILGQLIKQIRDLTQYLRPPLLDDASLVDAIDWHVARYQAQTGITVLLDLVGLERRYAPDIELAVYRIIQEALTNIARHARVKQAAITLAEENGVIHVTIADHGAGFEVKKVLSQSDSVGLWSMRERAFLLGGELQIHSTPGTGTRIQANLPTRLPG